MSQQRSLHFERIFCPTDLTDHSNHALRYAVTLARAFRAKLYAIHCIPTPAGTIPQNRSAIEAKLRHTVRENIHGGALPPLDWETVLIDGSPTRDLLKMASEERCDLIVMASRHRPQVTGLLGTVAEEICRSAPCPVLITHEREREWVGLTANDFDLKKIVVATDFSSDAELALSYGLSLGREFGAEVLVMHVLPPIPKSVEPDTPQLPMVLDGIFHQTEQQLLRAVASEAAKSVTVTPVVREGQPYREVLDIAEDQHVDLICMGVHGAGFGMRALFGSNVDRVLRQSPCPVLIARPLKPALPQSEQSSNIHREVMLV